ncbi:bifunctional phosphopantothenoylcysteine decarboxylase/phosphopantothenate--cysteine ligase CoaBC [Deltaproteobacteria bacterium]|nr:bifunctional phosphopantothenoylcysteine decarboxylase/phosphopantothenate--cysteine ligase CoaBC [Deltaproteobacteria bacterium]
MMKDKKIIVGVTGGIAAYKAAELVRIFVKAGAEIRVAMTVNATRFIAPLTLEALSGNKVVWDMFAPETHPISHITWGQESDLVIIAPATANFIAKMAHGIADDFLSTMVLATTAKILVCPAMNSQMFENSATRENIKLINERGCLVMEPGEGELACHTEGPGRLPDPEDIAEQARAILTEKDLSGLRLLVTAGPTIESMDPVRYISNRSTGKMGYALARAASMRGASVTLVSGPAALSPPDGIKFHGVKSAEEMRRVVFDNHGDSDVIIKAAAVSDYRPGESSLQKIKKGADTLSIDLVKNPDILAELGKAKAEHGYILVGFAAETENLLENATEKLRNKNLDIIVLNDVTREDAGFEADTNLVKIIQGDGKREDLPLMSKDDVANQILDRIKALRKSQA